MLGKHDCLSCSIRALAFAFTKLQSLLSITKYFDMILHKYAFKHIKKGCVKIIDFDTTLNVL